MRQVRPRDLDVVAEDAVELDLQRRDPGAGPLARLDGGDAVASARGDVAELVELTRDAFVDVAAFSRERRRVGAEQAGELGGERRAEVVALVSEAQEVGLAGRRTADLPRVRLGERRPELRQRRQRASQHREIPRRRHAEPGAPDQPFEIGDPAQDLARPIARGVRADQPLDRVVTPPNGRQIDRREEEPAAQKAPPHRRTRLVEQFDERAGPTTLLQRFAELEVRARLLVEDQRVGTGVDLQAGERQLGPRLGGARVAQDGRGRGGGARQPLEDRGVERGTERARQLDRRIAVVDRGPRQAREGDLDHVGERPVGVTAAEHQLARGDAADLFDQDLRAGGLHRLEVAGGDIEKGEPVAAAGVPDHRRHVAGGARIERLLVEHHARRDHPNHVALDDPARDLGVLELLAERDAVAEVGQLGHVRAHRVVRHAAHGDRVLLPLVARGERQIEDAGRVDRVVVEHLVEVAQPEQHDGVRIPRLDVEVLAHQRGGRGSLHGCAGARTRLLGYFFGAAAFFLAGFALAAAFSLPAVFFFAMRAFSFRCRVRRRIFIDRRLSRRPIRSQYPDSSAAVKRGSRGGNDSAVKL